MKVKDKTLRAIQTIDDAIIQGRKLTISITVVEDEGYDLPTLDVTVIENGEQIFGDLNFETFEEMIQALAEGI